MPAAYQTIDEPQESARYAAGRLTGTFCTGEHRPSAYALAGAAAALVPLTGARAVPPTTRAAHLGRLGPGFSQPEPAAGPCVQGSAQLCAYMKKHLPGRLLLIACACAALASCGGGGSGQEADTGNLSEPPSLNTPPESPLQIRSAYQPGVRSLGNDPNGPQLQEAAADGKLRFDRATDAKAGDVLVVDGKAYVVTAAEQGGTLLSTRAPQLDEVFESLTLRGKIALGPTEQKASLQGRESRMLAIGEINQSLSYAYDFYLMPQIKASVGVNVGITAEIDFDYDARSGIRRFDFSANGNFGESINVTFDTSNGNSKSPDGIEVFRWVLPIAQTGGLAAIEIPLMVTAQYTGSAKTEVPLQAGSSNFQMSARLNPETGRLETSGTFGGNSTAGAPTLIEPIPHKTTSSLGLGFKVGPDVQFTLLKGSLAPVTVGVRAGTELGGEAVNDGTRTCLGWEIGLKGEMSAELKVTDALKMSQSYTTAATQLAQGGNLAECEQPPEETPPDVGELPGSEASVAFSTPKGELLLNSPANLPVPSDLDFRIVEFRGRPQDWNCNTSTTGANPSYTYTLCGNVIATALFRKGETTPIDFQSDMTLPYLPDFYSPVSVCRFQASSYFLDSDSEPSGLIGEVQAAEVIVRDYLDGWGPGFKPAITRLVSGTTPWSVSAKPFRVVCQLELYKRSAPSERFFVRQERYFSDFAWLNNGNRPSSGTDTWQPITWR